MFAKQKEKVESKDNIVFDYVKGLIIAVVVSFALIVLTAIFIKFASVSDEWLIPITLVIKGVSVLIGSIFALKRQTAKGLFKGAIFGLIYVFIAFLVFGLLAGSLSFDLSLLLDFVFCTVLGGLVGIVKVNRN